jgi:hypothetical protein
MALRSLAPMMDVHQCRIVLLAFRIRKPYRVSQKYFQSLDS